MDFLIGLFFIAVYRGKFAFFFFVSCLSLSLFRLRARAINLSEHNYKAFSRKNNYGFGDLRKINIQSAASERSGAAIKF